MQKAENRDRYEHKVIYLEYNSNTTNKEDAMAMTEELAKYKSWQVANVVNTSSGRFYIFLTREVV